MMPFLLIAVLAYVVVGLVVGLLFVIRGVNRVDPAAASSPLIFRVVILPGSIGLWPVVLLKWIRASKGGQA